MFDRCRSAVTVEQTIAWRARAKAAAPPRGNRQTSLLALVAGLRHNWNSGDPTSAPISPLAGHAIAIGSASKKWVHRGPLRC
jgi:hypothetical protein